MVGGALCFLRSFRRFLSRLSQTRWRWCIRLYRGALRLARARCSGCHRRGQARRRRVAATLTRLSLGQAGRERRRITRRRSRSPVRRTATAFISVPPATGAATNSHIASRRLVQSGPLDCRHTPSRGRLAGDRGNIDKAGNLSRLQHSPFRTGRFHRASRFCFPVDTCETWRTGGDSAIRLPLVIHGLSGNTRTGSRVQGGGISAGRPTRIAHPRARPALGEGRGSSWPGGLLRRGRLTWIAPHPPPDRPNCRAQQNQSEHCQPSALGPTQGLRWTGRRGRRQCGVDLLIPRFRRIALHHRGPGRSVETPAANHPPRFGAHGMGRQSMIGHPHESFEQPFHPTNLGSLACFSFCRQVADGIAQTPPQLGQGSGVGPGSLPGAAPAPVHRAPAGPAVRFEQNGAQGKPHQWPGRMRHPPADLSRPRLRILRLPLDPLVTHGAPPSEDNRVTSGQL